MYKVISESRGVRRSFSISLGLAEGYGPEGKIHDEFEVVEMTLAWMKGRAAEGKPFLTGTVGTGTVVYAWPEGPGKAGGGSESSVEFRGEVSPLYNADLPDGEVAELLNELASVLGVELGQTRIYVAYRDEVWILQREESVTPTGEKV